MKNRSGKLQQRNKPMSKSSKSKLQIATGLAFLIFAVWLFMSTKNYASNSYPLVSKHITIEHENRSLELDEAQSKNISKRLQNTLRIREHESTEFHTSLILNNGITIRLNMDENTGLIEYQNKKEQVRVDRSLIKAIQKLITP